MNSRNEILTELDNIEIQLKGINVDADNNGNYERSNKHQLLIDREDELMEMLGQFPI